MAELIARHQLRCGVEIGVYRGRSLLPMSVAMRSLTQGHVTGIDPYSARAARQADHGLGEELDRFIDGLDWDELYREVVARIDQAGLTDHCRILRTPSEDAAACFVDASIDLLHIDGNHDRVVVERDVEVYLPKLRPGGVLVLDDVSWPSVRPISLELEQVLDRVLELSDRGRLLDRTQNDFAVFRRVSD